MDPTNNTQTSQNFNFSGANNSLEPSIIIENTVNVLKGGLLFPKDKML